MYYYCVRPHLKRLKQCLLAETPRGKPNGSRESRKNTIRFFLVRNHIGRTLPPRTPGNHRRTCVHPYVPSTFGVTTAVSRSGGGWGSGSIFLGTGGLALGVFWGSMPYGYALIWLLFLPCGAEKKLESKRRRCKAEYLRSSMVHRCLRRGQNVCLSEEHARFSVQRRLSASQNPMFWGQDIHTSVFQPVRACETQQCVCV